MYSPIFLTKDEILDKSSDRNSVIARLQALDCNSDDEMISYLKKYTGVLYTSFCGGGALSPAQKRDYMIDAFIDGSWRKLTNKDFIISLIDRGIEIVD